MREYFIVSLCKNGILGGGIAASSEAITFHTGKLTIPDKYKHIEMKYKDIRALKKGRLFGFPTVTLEMNSGEEFRFIVFARKRFADLLKEKGVGQ